MAALSGSRRGRSSLAPSSAASKVLGVAHGGGVRRSWPALMKLG